MRDVHVIIFFLSFSVITDVTIFSCIHFWFCFSCVYVSDAERWRCISLFEFFYFWSLTFAKREKGGGDFLYDLCVFVVLAVVVGSR